MLPLAFRPKLLDCLRAGYTRADFAADLAAGLTVGVVALPLAMAFAIASGLPPQAGIYTSIVAGFLISLLGGSRVQIGGPTGAYVVVVYGIVARYGVANLAICTIAAGAILLALGVFRLGGLIRLIPVGIVIGFTNGIALLILLSQARDFLGLAKPLPEEFFAKLRYLAGHLGDADPIPLSLALACVLVIYAWPRRVMSGGEALEAIDGAKPPEHSAPLATGRAAMLRRVLAPFPAPIVVLVVASVAAALLELPLETIGTRFGGVPQGLPDLAMPAITLSRLRDLVGPIIAIALLGAIESLLSARVADTMIGDRHDPNQELMAQGIANLVTPFVGGIPATGAIARTATNVRAGGRTPIAGVIHSVTLLAIVLVAAPLARYVPLSALAAVLVVVAINMGDWKAFRELRRYSVPYRVVLLATFALTVAFDLATAVEVGLVLSALFFIYRLAELTRVDRIESPVEGVAIYRLFGALFFGSVARLDRLREAAQDGTRVAILDMEQVVSLDNTALDALADVQRSLAAHGVTMILCGLNAHPAAQLERSDLPLRIGEGRIVESRDDALRIARGILQQTSPRVPRP